MASNNGVPVIGERERNAGEDSGSIGESGSSARVEKFRAGGMKMEKPGGEEVGVDLLQVCGRANHPLHPT